MLKLTIVPALYFKSFSVFTEARIPFEVLSLAGVSKKIGWHTTIIDFNNKSNNVKCNFAESIFPSFDFDENFYLKASDIILSSNADIYLFPITIHTTGNLIHSILIANELSKISSKIIIFCGLGASSIDKHLLKKYSFIKFIIRGEIEKTLENFLVSLSELKNQDSDLIDKLLEKTVGITYIDSLNNIIENKDRDLIQNLDELPNPLFILYKNVIKKESNLVKNIKYLSVEEHIHLEAGRGCPFKCTFCSNSYLWKRRVRYKSPKKLVAEIEYCNKEFSATKFLLHHQIFTVNSNWVKNFCNLLIEKNLNIEWSCFTRSDCVNYSLLLLMKKAGCNTILFGIESSSAKIQKLTNKNLKMEKAYKGIVETLKVGIKPQISYIIGFPEETLDDIQFTFKDYFKYKYLDGCDAQIGLLSPVGGTDILQDNYHTIKYDGVSTTTWYTRLFLSSSEIIIKENKTLFPQNHYIPTNHPRLYYHFLKRIDFSANYLYVSFKFLYIICNANILDLYNVYKLWEDKFNINKDLTLSLSWKDSIFKIIRQVINILYTIVDNSHLEKREINIFQELINYEIWLVFNGIIASNNMHATISNKHIYKSNSVEEVNNMFISKYNIDKFYNEILLSSNNHINITNLNEENITYKIDKYEEFNLIISKYKNENFQSNFKYTVKQIEF